MIKLPKIKFVKSSTNFEYGNQYRKIFMLVFCAGDGPGFEYGGCFCHQDYDDIDLVLGENKKIHFDKIKAPMIIVTRQDNFFKTLESFLHELGHYVIWVFAYWNKRNRIYDYLVEIYEKFFQ